MLLVLARGRGDPRLASAGSTSASSAFQPSEFGKVLFILVLAGVPRRPREADRRTGARRSRAVGYALVPILLVFVQPDIGTALVYTAALAAVLFVAGVRWLHLGVLAAVAVLGALAILWLLPAAGRERAQAVPVGAPHRLHASRRATRAARRTTCASRSPPSARAACAAAASLGATQTRLNYLPEHATDFAFASLAEQRGFFGASILLLLYLLVVWRGLKIVAGARDLYCAIVAGGIAFMFLFQVFVNSAMAMGIAPITGIPLPFVSVGGSSMITNFLAIGILQAIHVRA